MSANRSFIFVGPSIGSENIRLLPEDSFTILPPAKRGDLPQLTRNSPPSTIVLVDGLFHQCLSVGHAEIREAMEQGWHVWGLSSLGAIRACEMRDFGMRGFGKVYERYIQDEDFQDDEVALLHGPLPPYPAFSEPLIHLRVAIEELEKQDLLSKAKAKEITARLKALWYGRRTMELFESLVFEAVLKRKKPTAKEVLSSFSRFRIKALDLQEFLKLRPWIF